MKTNKNRKKFKIKDRKRFLIIFWTLISLPVVAIATLLLTIQAGGFGALPTFEELENPKSNISTEIISEDGVLLGSYFVENRSFVDYDQISPNVIAALVATEDSRFFSHSGIDFWGLVRVGIKTIALGQNQGGGSTISQQLAKNLYPRDTTVYSSKTARYSALVLAKMKEWITAVMLEHNYTKEEIATMYLNIVFYGSHAYGIKSASETFFGKRPSELSIEEAAVLVGVVNAPTKFSPTRNPNNALKRRNLVLERISQAGYITSKQCDSLQNIPINLNYKQISHNVGMATYFRSMLSKYIKAYEPKRNHFYSDWDYKVAKELWQNDPLYGWCNKNRKKDGSAYDIYRDGIKIYTTINSKMQQHAEKAVWDNMSKSVQPRFDRQLKAKDTLFLDVEDKERDAILARAIRQSERYRVLKNSGANKAQIDANFKKPADMKIFSYQHPNGIDTTMTPLDSILWAKKFLRAGFVAIEPSTGHVKAYVGGTSHRFFQYDMASQGKRQAGSTFKPLVYTFAIDQIGLTPCTMVPNSPVVVDGWSPKESGKVEQLGELRPLWWGLSRSRNNYSAWVMKQANQPKAVASFINRLGIKSFVDPVNPLCLGTSDVSLFEMVGAYTNFVNNGIHIEPNFVTRIEDRHGNILATFSPQSGDVISSQSAFSMLQMLQKVVDAGTGARLRWMYKFTGEMGGKTGTTNNNSDSWFIGVTPKIVAGSWVGGEDRSIHFIKGGEGAVVSMPAYASFMQSVYADKTLSINQTDKFIRPEGAIIFDCPDTVAEPTMINPDTLSVTIDKTTKKSTTESPSNDDFFF